MATRDRLVISTRKSVELIKLKYPFHGSNRGSNPRGDATKEVIRLPAYPLLPGLAERLALPTKAHKKTRSNTRNHKSICDLSVISKRVNARGSR